MTKYPDLFAALAAPFAKDGVKVYTVQGRKIYYITARTVMNRLDDVVGPENWWDEYVPSEKSVLCRLTIRLPDGLTLTKADAGGYAGMSDSGDDDKSGYSDAFKRAAVKFGVARYLYRDGVPAFASGASATPATPAAKPDVRPWNQFIDGALADMHAAWAREMRDHDVPREDRERYAELANPFQVVNHLASRLIELGRVEPREVNRDSDPTRRDPTKARAVVIDVYLRSPRAVTDAVLKYLARKREEARAALGMDDEADEIESTPEDDGVANNPADA
jgi:hypothetical protein